MAQPSKAPKQVAYLRSNICNFVQLFYSKDQTTVLPPPGIVEESEELDLELQAEQSPLNSLQSSPSLPSPLLVLEAEAEHDSLATNRPTPTAPKSAWKSIVASTPPPKQSIDPADWPKPAAAMTAAPPPPRTNQPNPTPLKHSQERTSALPPTASW